MPTYEPKADDCCMTKWNAGDPSKHVRVRMVGQGVDRLLIGFTRFGSYTDGIMTWEAFVDTYAPCTDSTHDHSK